MRTRKLSRSDDEKERPKPDRAAVRRRIEQDYKDKIWGPEHIGENENDEDKDKSEENEEQIEKEIAFCCANCKCTKKEREAFGDGMFFSMDADGANHRKCCHQVQQLHDQWLTEYHEALEMHLFGEEEGAAQDANGEIKCSLRAMADNYVKAYVDVAANHDPAVAKQVPITNIMRTDTAVYARQVLSPFSKACQRRRKLEETGELSRKSAVVLDCFAGIGSGVVALKQLGIAIHKVIHVEHDLIPSYVYRVNHDRSFIRTLAEYDVRSLGTNNGLSALKEITLPVPPLDSAQIEHIYYDDFEEVEENIASIWKKHGGTKQTSKVKGPLSLCVFVSIYRVLPLVFSP